MLGFRFVQTAPNLASEVTAAARTVGFSRITLKREVCSLFMVTMVTASRGEGLGKCSISLLGGGCVTMTNYHGYRGFP